MEKNNPQPNVQELRTKPDPQKIIFTESKGNLPVIKLSEDALKAFNRGKIVLLVCYVAGSQSGKSFLISKYSSCRVVLGNGEIQTAECDAHPDETSPFIIHIDTEGFSTNSNLPGSIVANSGFENNLFRGPALNKFIPRFAYIIGSTFTIPSWQVNPKENVCRTVEFLRIFINAGFPKIPLVIVWNAVGPWDSSFHDDSGKMWKAIEEDMDQDKRQLICELFTSVAVIAIPNMQAAFRPVTQNERLLQFMRQRQGAPIAAPVNLPEILQQRCAQLKRHFESSMPFKRFTVQQMVTLMNWSIGKLTVENPVPHYDNFINEIMSDKTIDGIFEESVVPFFVQLQHDVPSKLQYVRAIKLSLPLLMAKTPIKEPSVMVRVVQKFLTRIQRLEPCCLQHPRVKNKVCQWTKEMHPNYHSEDVGILARFKKFPIPSGAFHSDLHEESLHNSIMSLAEDLIAEPWQNLIEVASSIGPIISSIIRANIPTWNSKLCLCCQDVLERRILYGCGHNHICPSCIKAHFTEDTLHTWKSALELVGLKTLTEDLSLPCKICIFKESAASETTVALILNHPRIFDPAIRFGLGRTERVAPFKAISHKIVLFNGRGASFKANIQMPEPSNEYVLFTDRQVHVPKGQMAEIMLSLVILKEDCQLCLPLQIEIDNYVLHFNLIARSHGLLVMQNQYSLVNSQKPKGEESKNIVKWNVGDDLYFYERSILDIKNGTILNLDIISRQLEIRMNNYFAPIIGIDVEVTDSQVLVSTITKTQGMPLTMCNHLCKTAKVWVIKQILEALEVLHSHGIYYYNLDAESIIVKDEKITFTEFPYANNNNQDSATAELQLLGVLIYELWTGQTFVPAANGETVRIVGGGETLNNLLAYCFNPNNGNLDLVHQIGLVEDSQKRCTTRSW